MNIKVNNVEITLTEEQLKHICVELDKSKLGKTKLYTIQDILNCKDDDKAYELACTILNIRPRNIDKYTHTPYPFSIIDIEEWNSHRLKIIIKACNFIDNDYKIWKPDFNKTTEYKYYKYFVLNNGKWKRGEGWRSVGFDINIFKNLLTCNLIGEKFINLYNLPKE